MKLKKVRLYIDGENMSAYHIYSYQEIAVKYGEISSIKVFGYFQNNSLIHWKNKSDICELVDIPNAGKNAADKKLIEVLESDFRCNKSDLYIIVSNDLGFIKTARHIIDEGGTIININTRDIKKELENNFTHAHTVSNTKRDPRVNLLITSIKDFIGDGSTKFSELIEKLNKKHGKLKTKEILGYTNTVGIAETIRRFNYFTFSTNGDVIYISVK